MEFVSPQMMTPPNQEETKVEVAAPQYEEMKLPPIAKAQKGETPMPMNAK